MLTVFLAGAFGGERIANQAATATEALGESLFRNCAAEAVRCSCWPP